LREVGFAAKPRVPFSQLSAVTAIALVDALTDAFRNGFSSAQ
jgi:hypothetical protein